MTFVHTVSCCTSCLSYLRMPAATCNMQACFERGRALHLDAVALTKRKRFHPNVGSVLFLLQADIRRTVFNLAYSGNLWNTAFCIILQLLCPLGCEGVGGRAPSAAPPAHLFLSPAATCYWKSAEGEELLLHRMLKTPACLHPWKVR